MLMMIAANCSAFVLGELDMNILEDMKKNPSNYIFFGGVGTGVSVYIDRRSLDVQQYSPPNYIISFKKIFYSVQPDLEKKLGNYKITTSYAIDRYKYNFNERKMYVEYLYRNGKLDTHWEYIEPTKSGTSGQRSIVSGGEIIFYLAYNMSFYNEPISELLKEYLKTGQWKTFDE